MNLRDLEYLTALERHGSFRAAAASCHVSQPTLSVQIRKLENELAVPLIDRASTPTTLTPVGRQIVERARIMLAEAQAIREIARSSLGHQHSLRLGVFPTLGPYLLPRVLPTLRNKLPGIEILLTEERTSTLLSMLSAGSLDAALIAEEVTDPLLHSEPLFREDFVLALPESHPSTHDTNGTHEDLGSSFTPLLDGHDLLVLSEGHCLGDQVRSWAASCGLTCRTDHSATSLETARQMVAGGGITLLPTLAVTTPFAPGEGVRVCSLGPDAPHRIVSLAWMASSPHSQMLAGIAHAFIPPKMGL